MTVAREIGYTSGMRLPPLAAILFGAALPGCAPAAPARDDATRVPAPPPVSARTTPIASDSAAPLSAPARPPLPAAPPGVDASDFAVLASVCPVASWDRGDKIMVGCRSTPPYAQPDGELLHAKDFAEVCFLEDVYRGSFSGPGKDEVILGLASCGKERWNDITPGDVVLAANGPDGWKVADVQRGANIHGCRTTARGGRTLLVCADNVGAYGDGSIAWRFTLDFSKPADTRYHVFAKLFENAPGSCMLGNGMLEERGATFVDTKAERWEDVDKDGDEDLIVTIERAAVKPSAALVKRADAWCAKQPADEPAVLRPEVLTGKPKRFELRFDGAADTLVPTAQTAKLLDTWGAEAPEFWWSMVK